MKKKYTFFLLLLIIIPISAQEGFVFDKGVEKVTVPMELINNLIFIPIKVNGVELNFLLDSGVEETILFSLKDNPGVTFYNSQRISLRGLGAEDAVEGLKTTSNILEVKGMKSFNQVIYVILDESFNLSSQIGIPVNGIIGCQFFRNNLVRIDYSSKKLIILKNDEIQRGKLKKRFQEVPITIERVKPYLLGKVDLQQKEVGVKLLIDTGNSDSVWLFQKINDQIQVPQKNFDDFLGKGFSGDVEGKRARIDRFSFDAFAFNHPIVAFPDSSSVRNVRMVKDRVGSVGGGILRRFTVVFDYQNQRLYLRKNGLFDEPFTYNKSGIEVKHHGLQWVQETVRMETVPVAGSISFDGSGKSNSNDFKYKFVLKPVYEIANIRKNSPAAESGLRVGDVLVEINDKAVHQFSLQKLNELFRSEEDKMIKLEVQREGRLLLFSFQLHDVL